MSRVAYPNEVGIVDKDIVEVRISTGKRAGHILKVRHRLFGYLGLGEWGLVSHVRDFIERQDPLYLIAWAGLTVTYHRAGILTFDTLTKFIDNVASFGTVPVEAVGSFFGVLADIIRQIPVVGEAAAVPSEIGEAGFTAVGAAGRAVLEQVKSALGIIGAFFGAAESWFWAAVAAALTIITAKTVAAIL